MADELDLQTQTTLRDSGAGTQPNLQPVIDPKSGDALDLLFKAKTEKKNDEPVTPVPSDPPVPVVDPAAPVAAATDDKDKDKDKPAKEGAPGDDNKPGAGNSGKAGDVPVPAEDPFKDIQLPPHTSPKASDSFNAIKAKAKTEIETRERDIAELRSKLKQFEGSVSATPEEKKELEDLRRFRASVEIEHDPEFKTAFQDRLEKNNEAIYAKLTEAGMTTEQIDKIKKMGGPLKLANWDDIYSHLTPSQKRVVDARLNDSEQLTQEREVKVKQAKENVEKYLQERDSKSKSSVEAESKIIENTANELLGQLPWTAEQVAEANAPEDRKRFVAEENKFAKEQVDKLRGLLVDRSAETHAMLAIGTIQAFRFKRELESASKELEQLRTANRELTEKLEKIKKSSLAPRSSNAPVGGPLKGTKSQFSTYAGDALDALRDAKLAEAN